MRDRCWKAVILLTLGAASAGCAGITPHATGTTLTTLSDVIVAKRVPVSVFSTEDSVVCYVYFQWQDVTQSAGRHQVEWRWYQNGTLVSEGHKRLLFRRSPFSTWTSRPAASFGVGHFTVETLLDGKSESMSDFEIRAPVRAPE